MAGIFNLQYSLKVTAVAECFKKCRCDARGADGTLKEPCHQNHLFNKTMWPVRSGTPISQLDGLTTWRDLHLSLKSPPRGIFGVKLPLACSHGAFLTTRRSKCFEIYFEVNLPTLIGLERARISKRNVAKLYQKGTSGKAFALLVCFSYIPHSGVVRAEC